MPDAEPTRFSLVVTTLGRREEIVRLLTSLERQTTRDFEVIVVDQNDEDILGSVLADGWSIPVRRLRTPHERGASRGRNHGWRNARGTYLIFPDDDCWYPDRFIETVERALEQRDLDALTGRPTDERGRTINGRFEARAQWITQKNVWTTQIEWLAVIRRSLLERLDGYDEDIGVGAATPWQSAEAQDLMLRALNEGARCWYDPDLNGHHDELARDGNSIAVVHKARRYGRGAGFVLRKHRLGWAAAIYWVGRPAAGALLATARGRLGLARLHAGTALGRLEGVVGVCFATL